MHHDSNFMSTRCGVFGCSTFRVFQSIIDLEEHTYNKAERAITNAQNVQKPPEQLKSNNSIKAISMT